MAKSVKDRLVEALVAGGGTVVPCRSRKYTEVVVGDQFKAKLLARAGA